MPRVRKENTSNGIEPDRLKSLDERYTRMEEEIRGVQRSQLSFHLSRASRPARAAAYLS